MKKINITKKHIWRANKRSEYNIENNSIVIGYLARKTADKGALLLLEAFSRIRSQVPNVKLMFIGPDDSNGVLDSYKSMHPKWDKDVIEIGSVSHHEEYISVFDVLCLPSYREGFGSIVIDAAALCIPTIGSRIPGLVDAIDDSVTGWLFNCGDIDDLCKHLINILEDIIVIQSCGRNAYDRVVEFYDSEVMARALEDSYRSLLHCSR